MNPFYKKYQRYCEVLFWVAFALVTATLNSLSVISDYERRNLVIDWWLPVVWEFSSQLSILMLVPVVIWIDRYRPIMLNQFKTAAVRFLVFSIAFSVLHVVLMVAMRHISYWGLGGSYDFGNWAQELFYEYRKDAMTYLRILATLYVYRFIVSRLLSEASIIEVGEDASPPTYVERFIIKKLGKEFIIRAQDIEWVEASGNYMNLHIGERCYPLRDTMAGLIARLDPQYFARVHRSYVVKLDLVKEIVPQASGDHTVHLKCGKTLKLSRRYRDELKGLL
jgi:hypothetical protein